MKRLSSSQLRKVLSGLAASRTYREIAEQVQIDKSTVGRVMGAVVNGIERPAQWLTEYYYRLARHFQRAQ